MTTIALTVQKLMPMLKFLIQTRQKLNARIPFQGHENMYSITISQKQYPFTSFYAAI